MDCYDGSGGGRSRHELHACLLYTSYFDDTEVLKTGIHQIKIPITPFWGGDGRYELLYVSLIDKNGNETFYEREGAWGDAVGDSLDFTLASVFDVAYYGSLSNSMGTLVGTIKALNDGETAVLDARNSTKAPKELFLAIAGTDKTLVFENDDIQLSLIHIYRSVSALISNINCF